MTVPSGASRSGGKGPYGSVPLYADLPGKDGLRHAWDVWGDRSTFGCLNFLSPERVVGASRLVTAGLVFPLNLALELPDPPLFGRARARHEVRRGSPVFQDDLLQDWNTQVSSQWDGFRHVCFPGRGYFGGLDDSQHGVHHWAQQGIAGRGVLADVARWRLSNGHPLRLDAPDPIEPEDLEACLASQGVTMEPGDILLVRTGWLAWYRSLDSEERAQKTNLKNLKTPGLRASEKMAQVLWDMHIAAIAADNPALEVWPIGALEQQAEKDTAATDPARAYKFHLHLRLIPMLGLPIGELFDLDRLAEDCGRDRRYTFLLTSAPLNLERGVASPPNALALK
jgi:kynurenine formamidase